MQPIFNPCSNSRTHTSFRNLTRRRLPRPPLSSAVVNATLEGHPPAAYDGHRPSFLHINIGDTVSADIAAQFERVASFISKAMAAGGAVLVHCSAGVSRSPTLAVAFLMLHQGMRLSEASKRVLAARPCACPNLAFAAALDALDRQLFPGQSNNNSSSSGSDVDMGTSGSNTPVTPATAGFQLGAGSGASASASGTSDRDCEMQDKPRPAVHETLGASVHKLNAMAGSRLSVPSLSVSGGDAATHAAQDADDFARPRSASFSGMSSCASNGMHSMHTAAATSPLLSPCYGGQPARSPQEV